MSRKTINNKHLTLAVFTDFDGTITKKDLGDEIFKVYGEFEPYNSRIKNDEMGIHEYWNVLCDKLRPGVTRETIVEFARAQETDTNFPAFVNFCEENNIPVSVISDGFDVYIHEVLGNLNLGHLPLYCNQLIFEGNNNPKPVFPRATESCTCKCASCKRNSMLANLPPDTVIVYIGDGFSDFCAAEHADIIFAKKELAAHCNEHKIPHYPWQNFFDVTRIMKNILRDGKYKIRNQAEMNRKRAFETE